MFGCILLLLLLEKRNQNGCTSVVYKLRTKHQIYVPSVIHVELSELSMTVISDFRKPTSGFTLVFFFLPYF